MAIDKVSVKMDIEFPKSRRVLGKAIHQQVHFGESLAGAIMHNVWYDSASKTIQCAPYQFVDGWAGRTDVTRRGIEAWNLNADHWDEVAYQQDKYLLSDGDSSEIQTNDTFEQNSGFLLQFYPFGGNSDEFECLRIKFGQWVFTLKTTGHATLAQMVAPEVGLEPIETFRAAGYVGSPSGWLRLNNMMNELLIMPMGNGCLLFKLNNGVAWAYKLPEAQLPVPGLEPIDPVIIDEGVFKLSAPNGRMRFQLTQLQYDVTADYDFITPNIHLENPPIAEQVFSSTVTDYWTGSGGAIVTINDPRTTADTIESLALFVPDGTKEDCCVRVGLVPGATTTPAVEGIHWEWAEVINPLADDPAVDITQDIMSLSISAGDDPINTECSIKLKNPEDYNLFGICNRLAQIKIGNAVILNGYLKDPATYARGDDGKPTSDIVIQAIAKLLNKPILQGGVVLDHLWHDAAVKYLCKKAGLCADDLMFDVDAAHNVVKPANATATGASQREFTTNSSDTPLQWINKICDETGWILADGYNESGNYVIKYQDPLLLSKTPVHTYVVDSADETQQEDYPYERIYRIDGQSSDPESNELYITGEDEEGNKIAVRYKVSALQDETLTSEERPDGWTGDSRKAFITMSGRNKRSRLVQLALRIGREVTKRLDYLDIEADWPAGLWVNDCIAIKTPVGEYADLAGTYRIKDIDIEFADESTTTPIRRAKISAVKLV